MTTYDIVEITGEKQARITRASVPEPKDGWALVKIAVTPMCTEYKSWLKGTPQRSLGHEAVGTVAKVGGDYGVRVGDRVAVMPQSPCGQCERCRAGNYIFCEGNNGHESLYGTKDGQATYAQYILKPQWQLLPIPEDVSFERAALAFCALGPAMSGRTRTRVNAFDTVMITGLGPVGLGGVVNAKYRAARVIAVDPIPYRREKALALGADVALDPLEDDYRQRLEAFGRPTVCLECAGRPESIRLCIDAVVRLGRIALIGECSDPVAIYPSPDFLRKGLEMIGVWFYRFEEFPQMMEIVRKYPSIETLVSHRFALRDIQAAFEVSAGPDHGKILLDPWG